MFFNKKPFKNTCIYALKMIYIVYNLKICKKDYVDTCREKKPLNIQLCKTKKNCLKLLWYY